METHEYIGLRESSKPSYLISFLLLIVVQANDLSVLLG